MSEPVKSPFAGINPWQAGGALVAVALAWSAMDARSQASERTIADHEARLRVVEQKVLSSLARIEQQLIQNERANP